jgi:peptidyl-dipeptidase A
MRPVAALVLALFVPGCGGASDEEPAEAANPDAAPSGEAATAFAREIDAGLRERWTAAEQAQWTLATDITDAHEAAAAKADEATMAYMSEIIPLSRRYADSDAPPDVRRQLDLLQRSAGLPAPSDAEKRKRLAKISNELAGMYGKGSWCPDGAAPKSDACLDLGDFEKTIGDVSLPPAERQAAWERWREVSKPMKPLYAEFVSLGNEGASELGYSDMGELWRDGYDMEPEAFAEEVDRLYAQVAPLYEELHCHVRAELNAQYGDEVIPPKGPIPAHLLGNMWAQDWDALYAGMTPYPNEPSLDVTAQLEAQAWDHLKMTKTAESFFVSMGLDPLPETFWERSMLVDPGDREVECHASAWDIGMQDDLRIKMCIQPTQEDLYTLHHELGHNYYFHYYHELPVLFQNGANDGFHEAVGDAVMLSVTPSYLKSIGLLEEASSTDEAVVNQQLNNALGAIAFLPFGRMIDQWRWDVFAGKVAPADYNTHWWKLRTDFQGIAPPAERPADAFDPGAKYHIPGNTPYMRYFLAQVLQYQFYAGMCEAAGHEGPLHTCSFHGSEAAGDRLKAMLALGASKPWPEALEVIAGTDRMDAGALLSYYAPLRTWLAEQNEGRECGW